MSLTHWPSPPSPSSSSLHSTKENRALPRPVVRITSTLDPQDTQSSKDTLSPLSLARKTLPSPPTSTPSLTPPVLGQKRKSVVFNDHHLPSAKSKPKHRSRPKTVTTASAGEISRPTGLQPPWSSLSRHHTDHHKRARLSLAVPNTAHLLRSPERLSLSNPRPPPLSPTGKRSSAKRLDRFIYNPRPASDPVSRHASPTPSTSAVQLSESASAQRRLLGDEDLNALLDEESDCSDDEIARALLPRNQPIHSSSRYASDSLQSALRRSASSPILSRRSEIASPDRFQDLRPILKKDNIQIHLAETVAEATRSNGRPKLAFDMLMSSARSRVSSSSASKALLAVTGASQDARKDVSARSTGPSTSVTGHHAMCNMTRRKGKRNEPDQSGDEESSSNDDNGDGSSPSISSVKLSEHEERLVASVRTSLLTLQASLLPPPSQMRLDPVSPLAKLTSPQKRQVGQLGNLMGSPREPKDLLPRAPIQNSKLEPSEIKSRMRKARSLVSSATSSAKRASIGTQATVSGTVPGPPRTPDRSSTVDLPAPWPRAVITLREVEEAYKSLYDNFPQLLQCWQEEQALDEAEQRTRTALLFEGELSSSLMKCLLREVENICRLEPSIVLSKVAGNTEVGVGPSSSSRSLVNPRDELCRLPPLPSSIQSSATSGLVPHRFSSPAIMCHTKVGSSTNAIRRRVAEIETGQAGMRFIALLWSWGACMSHIDEAHTQRLISLLVDIPGLPVLQCKKNLPVIGAFNLIFMRQTLGPSLLGPHSLAIIDAVTHTLYLSGGKSGDKGKRVLILGLGALHQLIHQMPEYIPPRMSRVVDPLLAALASPEASSLRHHGLRGLGALINCTKPDWDQALRPSAVAWRLSKACNSNNYQSRSEVQMIKKEDFRDKVSIYTFAHLNDHDTFRTWHMLNRQFGESLKAGDVGWVISSMATIIALLGKRIRRTDPPVTKCFKPHIQILLQKDGPIKHLAQQLWDYYILVMLIWSIENIQTQKVEEVWALDKTQLPFFLQIFHHSYFWVSNVPSTAPATGLSLQSPRPMIPSKDYEGLLRPGDVSKRTSMPTDLAPPKPAIVNSVATRSRQTKREASLKQSTLHHSISAFLYGTIGCVQTYLPMPTLLSSHGLTKAAIKPPGEWLESVVKSARFRHLDIIWDEIIERSLPKLLAGPVDEHRVYACDILVALCGGATPNQAWTLERLIHPVYHDPPSQDGPAARINLEEFSHLARLSAVSPSEIPAIDWLWICCRANKMLALVSQALESRTLIVDPDQFDCCLDLNTRRFVPRSICKVWQAYARALKQIQTGFQFIEQRFSQAFSALVSVLESSLLESSDSVLVFRELYETLRQEMGEELMGQQGVTCRLARFLLTPDAYARFLNQKDEGGDWENYVAVVKMVLVDVVKARKALGSPGRMSELGRELARLGSDCQIEKLRRVVVEMSAKPTAELLKHVETGVECDEAPIEEALVSLVGLHLSLGTEPEEGVIKALVRLIGRASDESFERLLIGCGKEMGDYFSRDVDEELFRACLEKYSTSYHDQARQEDFLSILRAPFLGSSSQSNGLVKLVMEYGYGLVILPKGHMSLMPPVTSPPPPPPSFASTSRVLADLSVLSPLRNPIVDDDDDLLLQLRFQSPNSQTPDRLEAIETRSAVSPPFNIRVRIPTQPLVSPAAAVITPTVSAPTPAVHAPASPEPASPKLASPAPAPAPPPPKLASPVPAPAPAPAPSSAVDSQPESPPSSSARHRRKRKRETALEGTLASVKPLQERILVRMKNQQFCNVTTRCSPCTSPVELSPSSVELKRKSGLRRSKRRRTGETGTDKGEMTGLNRGDRDSSLSSIQSEGSVQDTREEPALKDGALVEEGSPTDQIDPSSLEVARDTKVKTAEVVVVALSGVRDLAIEAVVEEPGPTDEPCTVKEPTTTETAKRDITKQAMTPPTASVPHDLCCARESGEADGLDSVRASPASASAVGGLTSARASPASASEADGSTSARTSPASVSVADGLTSVRASPASASEADGLSLARASPASASEADGLTSARESPASASVADGLTSARASPTSASCSSQEVDELTEDWNMADPTSAKADVCLGKEADNEDVENSIEDASVRCANARKEEASDNESTSEPSKDAMLSLPPETACPTDNQALAPPQPISTSHEARLSLLKLDQHHRSESLERDRREVVTTSAEADKGLEAKAKRMMMIGPAGLADSNLGMSFSSAVHGRLSSLGASNKMSKMVVPGLVYKKASGDQDPSLSPAESLLSPIQLDHRAALSEPRMSLLAGRTYEQPVSLHGTDESLPKVVMENSGGSEIAVSDAVEADEPPSSNVEAATAPSSPTIASTQKTAQQATPVTKQSQSRLTPVVVIGLSPLSRKGSSTLSSSPNHPCSRQTRSQFQASARTSTNCNEEDRDNSTNHPGGATLGTDSQAGVPVTSFEREEAPLLRDCDPKPALVLGPPTPPQVQSSVVNVDHVDKSKLSDREPGLGPSASPTSIVRTDGPETSHLSDHDRTHEHQTHKSSSQAPSSMSSLDDLQAGRKVLHVNPSCASAPRRQTRSRARASIIDSGDCEKRYPLSRPPKDHPRCQASVPITSFDLPTAEQTLPDCEGSHNSASTPVCVLIAPREEIQEDIRTLNATSRDSSEEPKLETRSLVPMSRPQASAPIASLEHHGQEASSVSNQRTGPPFGRLTRSKARASLASIEDHSPDKASAEVESSLKMQPGLFQAPASPPPQGRSFGDGDDADPDTDVQPSTYIATPDQQDTKGSVPLRPTFVAIPARKTRSLARASLASFDLQIEQDVSVREGSSESSLCRQTRSQTRASIGSLCISSLDGHESGNCTGGEDVGCSLPHGASAQTDTPDANHEDMSTDQASRESSPLTDLESLDERAVLKPAQAFLEDNISPSVGQRPVSRGRGHGGHSTETVEGCFDAASRVQQKRPRRLTRHSTASSGGMSPPPAKRTRLSARMSAVAGCGAQDAGEVGDEANGPRPSRIDPRLRGLETDVVGRGDRLERASSTSGGSRLRARAVTSSGPPDVASSARESGHDGAIDEEGSRELGESQVTLSGENTQDIRTHVQGLSTRSLLRLSRVTKSLIEDRVIRRSRRTADGATADQRIDN